MVSASHGSLHAGRSTRTSIFFVLLSALLWPQAAQPASATPVPRAATSAPAPAVPANAAPGPGPAALAFEPNAGQTDPAVRFLARGRNATLFFTPGEVVLALAAPQAAGGASAPGDPPDARVHGDASSPRAVVRLRFEGANPAPDIAGFDRLAGVVNYLRGNDPARWHTGLPTYAGIRYEALYPGIALQYEGGGSSLKGTYSVAPGADPGRIRWRYDGVNGVRVDEATGDLQIGLSGAGVPGLVEHAPVAWQTAGGQRVAVSAAYVIGDDGEIGLALGTYDHSLALTIDPLLEYSTYLGGSWGDEGNAIAVDADGNAYVAGDTLSWDFPTANAFDSSTNGGKDAFVAKLSAAGNTLVYATFLGGTNDDIANGVAVDRAGYVVVAGATKSLNWPLAGAIQGTLQNVNGEGFLAKLLPGGGGLLFSTYLGGGGRTSAQAVATDYDNNIYVTGSTDGGFPLVAPYQPLSRGGDAFVAKLNPAGTRFFYSTYLGGSSVEDGSAIAVDWEGHAFVTGRTFSTDFPVVNPYQAQCKPPAGSTTGCSVDAFLSELSADGSALLYSTYLGSSAVDEAHGVAVDEEGKVVVAGVTEGTDFPNVNAAQPAYGGGRSDAFVAKINPVSGQPVFASYLGGNNDEDYFIGSSGIAVDGEGNVTVTGSTASGNFPLLHPIKALKSDMVTNAFVTQYTPAGQLVYSTYLGGDNGNDAGQVVATDVAGKVYVSGMTQQIDFPTVNAFQPATGGGYSDAFVTKIANGPGVSLRFSPPNLDFAELRSGETSLAQTVTLQNAGTAPVTISGLMLNGANSLDFAMNASNCAHVTLAPGATCQVSATFSPRASGYRYARVEVSSGYWAVTRNIFLRGQGAPAAELNPGPLDFPITKRNTTSAVLVEHLKNVGLEALALGNTVITGTNAADFTIIGDQCSNHTLQPDNDCGVSLTFTPHADGQRFAFVSFSSAVFDAPVKAPLSGTGGNTPAITVDGAEWGMCEGQTVTVSGINFPLPGAGNQGQYLVSLDGVVRASGTTDVNGRFVVSFTMPSLTGTSHVVTAADMAVTSASASATVRSPEKGLPVIIVPGVSASYLDSGSPFVYTAWPDPELAYPFPDPTQLLPSISPVFAGGEHIWLDWVGVGAALASNYRFLDMLALKPDGVTPQPDMLGVVPDIRVGSILWDIRFTLLYSDFYKSLRDYLLATGRYSDTPGYGRNLYYFSYDWRKDIRLTGPALNDMVNQAMATSGKDKVILLAHSMGGLVSRNYLLTYGTGKVDQLITMATPYLGSPLVGKVLEIGDDWGIGVHIPLSDLGAGMHPKEMKRLAQNFPSTYELLPSSLYFDTSNDPAFDPHYMVTSTSIDGQFTINPLSYVDSIAFMSRNHNAALNQSAEVFRNTGVGDLSLLAGQLFNERIFGVNVPSIGRMVESPSQVCATLPIVGLQCFPYFQLKIPLIDIYGDGTVSKHSALGGNAPPDQRTYSVWEVKHTDVPGSAGTLYLVDQMLLGQRCSNVNPPLPMVGGIGIGAPQGTAPTGASPRAPGAIAAADSAPDLVTGVQIQATGNVTMTVTDGQGRQEGALAGVPYGEKDEIPGASYQTTDGGQFIALTDDGTYTVTLHAMSPTGAAALRISTLTNGSITQANLFESIPVTGTTAATVTLTLQPEGGPVIGGPLAYKYDGQTPVQQAPALPPLSGAAAQDMQAPVTTISVGPDRQVTLTATDTGASGVQKVLYSVDGGAHYQLYTGPFAFAGAVRAVAIDWAGNAEYPPAALPTVYLPVLTR